MVENNYAIVIISMVDDNYHYISTIVLVACSTVVGVQTAPHRYGLLATSRNHSERLTWDNTEFDRRLGRSRWLVLSKIWDYSD